MAWKFHKAFRKGRDVTVIFQDASNPQDIQYDRKTWGFDPADLMSQNEFRAMVKREAKIWLNHLNQTETETDVTEEFNPDS